MSLIAGKYYRGDPKVKPQQWGSFADVQSALFHNVEKIGIDPRATKVAFLTWEGAGAFHDYISGAGVDLVTNVTWGSPGYLSFSSAYVNTGIPSFVNDAFTVFFSARMADNGVDGGIIETKGGSGNWGNSTGWSISTKNTFARDGGLTFKVGSSEAYVNVTDISDVSGLHPVICNFKSSSKQDIFVDGTEVSYDTHNIASSYTGTNSYVLGGYYNYAADRRLTGDLSDIFVFSTSLNDSQISVLSDNPYQLIQPTANRSYFFIEDTGSSLLPNNITTGAPVLGTPTLGQTHALSSSNITAGSPVLEAPTVGQVHALTADNIATAAPTLGTPTAAVATATESIYIDSTAGTGGDGSESTPYDSLSDINWTTGGANSVYDWVAAGKDVFINLSGTFTGTYFNIPTDGTSDHPITIQSYGGSHATIDGDGTYRPIRYEASHITVKDLILTSDSTKDGIGGSTIETGIIVDNVEIYGCRGGIDLIGGGTIKNCNIHDNAQYGARITSCDSDTGQIYNNTITDNGTVSESWDGIFVGNSDGGTFHVYGNTVTGQIGQSSIDTSATSGDSPSTYYIYNNYVSGSNDYGIAAGDSAVADTFHIYSNVVESDGMTWGLVTRELGTYNIYHNTVFGTGTSGLYSYQATTRTINLKNNVFVGFDHCLHINETGLTIDADYNYFHSPAECVWLDGTEKTLAQWQAASGGANSVEANPTINADGRLVTNSPCIDAGVTITGINDSGSDYWGNSSNRTSIGAYWGTGEAPDALTADDITTGVPVLDTPTIGQIHVLTADNITATAPDLGTPTVGQIHVLTASNIATAAPTLGTPSLSEEAATLTANNITAGVPVLGTPTVTQIHALTAVDITAGVPSLGSPRVNYTTPDTPTIRTYSIAAENRVYSIEYEDRTLTA